MDLVSVDSITIELNVVAVPAHEEGQVCMHGNLELYINEIKPYNDYSDIIQTKSMFKFRFLANMSGKFL